MLWPIRFEQQQTHPKLDYSAILSDVFASKEDMAAVRRLESADLRKFFRRAQLVRLALGLAHQY